MIREISKRFAPPKTQEELQKIWEELQREGVEFQNFYQELEMSYPMAETHRDETYTNATVTLHSHDFYEMLYCRSSDRVEYLVGTERYRLQPGDIVIVSPGVSHRPMLPEDMSVAYKRDIIWYSRELVQSICRMIPSARQVWPQKDGVLLRTRGTKWEFLSELFRYGVKEAARGKAEFEGVVLGNTIMILAHISRALQEGVDNMQAEKPELLDRVMAYIEDHLSEKITLEETASAFYVSVSTITQLFRQRMGTSFYRLVTQRRLIAAKTRIGQGENLEDVSRAVGFQDYSSFYRAFKKEYGISPRQFTKL